MARWRSLVRGVVFAVPAILLTVASAQPASAQEADLVIPLDTVIVDGDPDAGPLPLEEVASGPLIGETCTVTAVQRGRGAPHPETNLLVSSGFTAATLPDVEREVGATTAADGPLTLGETIVIELELGPDLAFSGDIDLVLDCGPASAAVAATDDTTSAEPTSGATGETNAEGSTGGALPATGSETTVALVLGMVLVLVGTALSTASRRSRPSEDGI